MKIVIVLVLFLVVVSILFDEAQINNGKPPLF